jgi:dolichol-phosphate mannosyltransferase
MSNLHKITMIVPTYNEAQNIERLIQEILSLPLPNLKVLVVDDNSPDGTGIVADGLKVVYPSRVEVLHRKGKEGLGKAYIAGIRKALSLDTDIIGQMDADFSHPPRKIVEMADCFDRHDVVIGSRYVEGGSVDLDWPVSRKLLSAFGNTYARTILGMPINDVTGGFRLFKREVLQAIPLDKIVSTGYVFMVELLYYAHLSKARIKEIPIFFKERATGQSKMSFNIQLEASIKIWGLLLNSRNIQREYAYRRHQVITGRV